MANEMNVQPAFAEFKDSKEDHAYKMLELLLLRCIRHNVTEFWSWEKACDPTLFDDNILLLVEDAEDSERCAYIIQYKEPQSCITEEELLTDNSDFSLLKCLSGMNKLKHLAKSRIENSTSVKFVFFINGTINETDFLVRDCPNVPFLNSNVNSCTYRVDLESFLKCYNEKWGCSLKQSEIDDNFCSVYLSIGEAESKCIDKQIVAEIEDIAKHRKLRHTDFRTVAEGFDAFVKNFYNCYNQTKHDITLKLCELFISQYEIDLSQHCFEFYTCPTKSIWNDIIKDKRVTLVEWDNKVLTFLRQYVGSEIKNICNGSGPMWNSTLSDGNDGFNDNTNSFLAFKKCSKFTMIDVYKWMWFDGQIALLLQVDDLRHYENIMHVLQEFNCDLKVIMVIKSLLPTIANVSKHFLTLCDLTEEQQQQILNQDISIQGRFAIKLGEFIDKSLFECVKCKDIVFILSKNYCIANQYRPLPDYYIERRLYKLILKVEVVKELDNEVFIIHNESGGNSILTEKLGHYDPKKVFITETDIPAEIDELKTKGTIIHRLVYHGDNWFEWRESLGSIKNISRYQQLDYKNLNDSVEDTLKTNFGNKFNTMRILNGSGGMGKTTVIDFAALEAPRGVWVLKISLNHHKSYFESMKLKTGGLTSFDHLNYFCSNTLQKEGCTNFELTQAILKKFAGTNKLLVLLDGYDDVAISYGNEIIEILKSLQSEMYHVWIAACPHNTTDLKEQLCVFPSNLKSFTVKDQKDFLMKYFLNIISNLGPIPENQKVVIREFSEKLLEMFKKNFGDENNKLTGTPLHLKLLADVSSSQLKSSLAVDTVNLKKRSDLLHFYEQFSRRAEEKQCSKYPNRAKEMREFLQKYQKLLALEFVFESRDLIRLNIQETLKEYFDNDRNLVQILQQDGLLEVVSRDSESRIIAKFTHRINAEYLTAQWLMENLNSPNCLVRAIVDTLVKRRFTRPLHYRFLFRFLDYLIAKDCPLHMTIFNGTVYEIELLINSNLENVSIVDKGGRTALHIAALYGENLIDMNGEMITFIRNIQDIKAANRRDTLLGYSALDCAVASKSLTIANIICSKLEDSIINIDIGDLDLKAFLRHCLRLEDHRPLTEALIKNDLCTKLLKKRIKEYASIHDYCNSFEYDDAMLEEDIDAYIRQFQVDTVSNLLQKMNLRSSRGSYFDLRLAAAFGTAENIFDLLSKGSSRMNHLGNFSFTPLHSAIVHERSEIVDVLLSKGADIDVVDINGNTALHLASEKIGSVLVEKLLIKGADVNKQNENGDTPLHHSLKHKCSDNAQFFLPKRNYHRYFSSLDGKNVKQFDINAQNNDGDTPLLLALKHGCTNIANLLLQLHADCNVVSNEGCSSLHYSASLGNKAITLELIYNCRNINKQNNNGETPLLLAVKNNHPSTVKLLLSAGSNPDVAESLSGYVCLHFAAQEGHKELVRSLINEKASIDVRSDNGSTPLSRAVLNKRLSTVELLVSEGADPHLVDNNGYSYLHHAAVVGATRIVLLFIEKGLGIDEQNGDGNTPLLLAAKQGYQNATQVLLEKEADVRIVNELGKTCLHYAAEEGMDKVIRKLVDKGADVNKQDNEGITPAMLAVRNRQSSVLRILLGKRADANIVDNRGNSCLHYAAISDSTEIIREFMDGDLDVNRENNEGETPLFLLLAHDFVDMNNAKLFFLNSDNVNTTGRNGNTFLHLAAKLGDGDLVLNVIKKGSDVNKRNTDGDAPIILAFRARNTSTIDMLLDEGADVNVIDSARGYSCLHFAVDMCEEEIVAKLISKGADVNQTDSEGATPLALSQQKGLSKVTKLLRRSVDLEAKLEDDYLRLYCSANDGNDDVILELIGTGFDINKLDEKNETALLSALKNRKLSTVKLLLAHGASVGAEDQNGSSCLHHAVEGGYDDVVLECIRRGADLNKQNQEGKTPLFISFDRNNISIIKLLLANGSNCKITSNNGDSCLHHAAEMGLNDIVADFIKEGADINAQNQNGATPLLCAAENHRITTARFLLANGADIQIGDNYGTFYLHVIVRWQLKDDIMSIFQKGVSVDKQNGSGMTPLLLALRDNNRYIAQLLITQGANVNALDEEDSSCLHYAASRGFDEIILSALSRGANINSKGGYGSYTPLMQAIIRRKSSTVRLLLHKGADVNIRSNDNSSCLHYAAQAGYDDIVTLLISKGLDMNQLNDSDDTPLTMALDNHLSTFKLMLSNGIENKNYNKNGNYLHYAARIGDADAVLELLNRGLNINSEDSSDETPLFTALKASKTKVAKLLLQHGADVSAADSRASSCLHSAAEAGEDSIVLDLLSKGADINKQDDAGKTPLIVAVDNGHISTTKLLLSMGADASIETNARMSCLHYAASRGAKNILLSLLEKSTDINKADGDFATPLTLALSLNKISTAKMLLGKGADVVTETDYRSSCLHHAIEIGAGAMVSELISKGCDINKKSEYESTPFGCALQYGKHGIAKLLLDKGADITNHASDYLRCAVEENYDDIVLELINKGVDINKPNAYLNGPPLFYALSNSKIKIAKLLLANNADVHVRNENGCSFLHAAAEGGDIGMVTTLIEMGLSINQESYYGDTPLFAALQSKKHSIAKLLLSKGADAISKNSDGRSCLHFAAEAGFDDVIADLLNLGLHINTEDRDGETPLLRALYYAKVNTAQYLLSCEADCKIANNRGITALHLAADEGFDRLVSELIRKGSDINYQNEWFSTPLFSALERGKINATKQLLDNGADVNISNYDGFSCLHCAVGLDSHEIVQYLINKSDNGINQVNSYGDTPLLIALEKKKLSTAKLLMAEGADTRIINNDGFSCLHYAARSGFDDIVEELLNKGCDLDRQTYYNDFPLLLALKDQHYSTAKLLISRGANVCLKDNEDCSCLHYAAKAGYDDVVVDLIKKGLDVNLQNYSEDTPLLLALESGKLVTTKLLLLNGADAELKNGMARSCLHHAATAGADDLVVELLNRGVSLNEKDDEDNTPLFLALKGKKVSTAKLLLSHGADLGMENKDGFSLMHFAAIAGDKDFILQLINQGLDINKQTNADDTPLMLALEHKNIEAAKLLISQGSDVNTGENERGCSYLHYAASAGDETLVLHFLSEGADINKCNQDSETPLLIAFEQRQETIAKLLISKGGNVEQKYGRNDSLLHYAAQYGCYEVLKEFVDSNASTTADLNVRNSSSQTPVHVAIAHQVLKSNEDLQRQITTIEFLLNHGANVDLQDEDGNTVLHYVSQEYWRIDDQDELSFKKKFCNKALDLLLTNKADVTIKNLNGCTALDIAIDNNSVELISLTQQTLKSLE